MRSLSIIAILSVVLCMSETLRAQGQGAPNMPVLGRQPSRADMFLNRTDAVVMKETFKLGTVGELQVDTIRLVELVSGLSISLVQLSSHHGGTETLMAIELDEIETIKRGIDVFLNKAASLTPTRPTEVTAFSRGGVELHMEWIMEGGTPRWNPYIKIGFAPTKVSVPIPLAELPNLSKILGAVQVIH